MGAALGGAALTGIALVVAVPPWNVAGLAWIAFWPLLRNLRDRPFAVRLAAGSLAGMVWSVGTVWPWLYPATRAHLAATAAGATGWTLLAAWIWDRLTGALPGLSAVEIAETCTSRCLYRPR